MLSAFLFSATEVASSTIFDQWWLGMKDQAMAGQLNFWQNIYKEIYQNVLYNDRWLNYLRGMGITLEVSFFAALVGLFLGLLVAMMRLSGVKPLQKIAGVYVGIIRGTPMLVQAFYLYFAMPQLIQYMGYSDFRIDVVTASILPDPATGRLDRSPVETRSARPAGQALGADY